MAKSHKRRTSKSNSSSGAKRAFLYGGFLILLCALIAVLVGSKGFRLKFSAWFNHWGAGAQAEAPIEDDKKEPTVPGGKDEENPKGDEGGEDLPQELLVIPLKFSITEIQNTEYEEYEIPEDALKAYNVTATVEKVDYAELNLKLVWSCGWANRSVLLPVSDFATLIPSMDSAIFILKQDPSEYIISIIVEQSIDEYTILQGALVYADEELTPIPSVEQEAEQELTGKFVVPEVISGNGLELYTLKIDKDEYTFAGVAEGAQEAYMLWVEYTDEADEVGELSYTLNADTFEGDLDEYVQLTKSTDGTNYILSLLQPFKGEVFIAVTETINGQIIRSVNLYISCT